VWRGGANHLNQCCRLCVRIQLWTNKAIAVPRDRYFNLDKSASNPEHRDTGCNLSRNGAPKEKIREDNQSDNPPVCKQKARVTVPFPLYAKPWSRSRRRLRRLCLQRVPGNHSRDDRPHGPTARSDREGWGNFCFGNSPWICAPSSSVTLFPHRVTFLDPRPILPPGTALFGRRWCCGTT